MHFYCFFQSFSGLQLISFHFSFYFCVYFAFLSLQTDPVSISNLVNGFLHLHQAQVGQRRLDEVHYGLQVVLLQDQRLVAPQQA